MKLEQLKISFKKLYLEEEQALISWVEQEQKLDFRGFENLKKTTMGEFSRDEQQYGINKKNEERRR